MGQVNVLDEWIAAAAGELGLTTADAPSATPAGIRLPQSRAATAQPEPEPEPASEPSATALVLDVARDVAHNVVRPGAPISAYLMGIAVGRGADPADVAARLSALAKNWPGNDNQ
ncbi:DUF6457 domain-containing protein [Actinoplanes sp. NPDC051859]|uniref:DUF6457 domain-containing protein n=1 Tax=Actinoplanes sp. NPDC051859 TaxID=3363909 RepID=UPI0037AE544E